MLWEKRNFTCVSEENDLVIIAVQIAQRHARVLQKMTKVRLLYRLLKICSKLLAKSFSIPTKLLL